MTDRIAELLTARQLGKMAYYLGRELTDNPFDKQRHPELAAAWEEGFKSEAGNWENFE